LDQRYIGALRFLYKKTLERRDLDFSNAQTQTAQEVTGIRGYSKRREP
jgi:hypothetical protein